MPGAMIHIDPHCHSLIVKLYVPLLFWSQFECKTGKYSYFEEFLDRNIIIFKFYCFVVSAGVELLIFIEALNVYINFVLCGLFSDVDRSKNLHNLCIPCIFSSAKSLSALD